MTIIRFILATLLAALLPAAALAQEPPEKIVVGNGQAVSCTAAALASALAAGGTVTFNCGAAPHTIPLTSEYRLTRDVAIDGGGTITLDGGGAVRIFFVNGNFTDAGITVSLSNITLTRGKSGGGNEAQYGGCIYNRSSRLTLSNVTITNCTAGEGGGVYSYRGELTISGSTIRANSANFGGGISSPVPGGRVTVLNSTVAENMITRDGGGIYINGSALVVSGSVIAANQSSGNAGVGIGAGIYTNKQGATADIRDTAFLDNVGWEGAGLFADLGTIMSIDGCTFVGNVARERGGGLGTYKSVVTVANSEFRANRARYGAGIFNGATNTLIGDRLTIRENQAEDDGGGAYNSSGFLALHRTSITDNLAGVAGRGDTRGGGIVSYNGHLTVTTTTVADNRVLDTPGYGGGIAAAGPTTIVNATISGNQSQLGAALYVNRATTTLRSSTLAGNTASSGDSIYWERSVTLLVRNAILARGGGAKNCASPGGALANEGSNIQTGDTLCLSGQPATDALLGPLADNGGPTATHALNAGSPAIDQGDPAACASGDQRGLQRTGRCDIGAFEFGAATPVAPLEIVVYAPVMRGP
jgi:hypothetical protein